MATLSDRVGAAPGPSGAPATGPRTDGIPPTAPSARPPRRSSGSRMRRWGRRNPLSVIGAAIVLGLVMMALLAPYLPLQNPVKMNVPKRFTPPGAAFWFGPDPP